MLHTIGSFWRGLPRGNVGLTFGLVATMVVGSVGAAMDITRAQERRADLQRAADAAVLAGASRPDMSLGEIESLAENNLEKGDLVGDATVTATRADGQVKVEIDATSPSIMMSIVGFDGLDVGATSEAEFVPGNGGKIEVALVLDTTESMADDMPELRSAALELVEKLYDVAGENVKISVVPYAGAVNIGNGPEQMNWMDVAGGSFYHGNAAEDWPLTECSNPSTDPPEGSTCWQPCDCPGKPACGGSGDGASLDLGGPTRFAGTLWRNFLGSSVAEAAGTNPYPEPDPSHCPIKVPFGISYFDLLDQIPNAEWMGCVEARPVKVGRDPDSHTVVDLDISDAPPDPSQPDTMFVPYFWPDESDTQAADNTWINNYIDDDGPGPAFDPTPSNYEVQEFPDWSDKKRHNIWKFDGSTSAIIQESTADMVGPNRSCPDALLALTEDRIATENRINTLTHRVGGGTLISEGLMWGWRTLSPGAPFTEGAAYVAAEGDPPTKKIIILLSDGGNSVTYRTFPDGSPDGDTLGDYTAYGFAKEYDTAWHGRHLIDSDANPSVDYFSQIRNFLDSRTLAACANIKAAGDVAGENPIEIYTLLVGDSDADNISLMETCATTVDKHYKQVSEIEVLGAAFEEVADGIIGSGSARLVH